MEATYKDINELTALAKEMVSTGELIALLSPENPLSGDPFICITTDNLLMVEFNPEDYEKYWCTKAYDRYHKQLKR